MLFIAWITSGLIGYLIGNGKGEGGKGAILSLLLGPIGWLIVAISDGDRKSCPHCKSKISKDATTCPQCHKAPTADAGPYRSPALADLAPAADVKQCPFCAEDIKAAAIVCKHCGKELAA